MERSINRKLLRIFDNDIIKICASNSDVDVINQQALEGIAQKEHEYEAQITGNYDKEFPTKEKLILKVE